MEVIHPFLVNKPAHREYLDNRAAFLRHKVNSALVEKLDVGLCHGDCHGCNVHNNAGSLMHFDFDCCGIGFRVFDLATFCWGSLNDSNARELWIKFLEGYRSKREISAEDIALVDAFVAIRHIWWMALIVGNTKDFGYGEANDEFIDHQVDYVKKLLARCNH